MQRLRAGTDSPEGERASGGLPMGAAGHVDNLGYVGIMGMTEASYSEMRIANAFKSPSLLTAEDIAEMQRRCIAEIKEWKRRKSKIQNVGEVLEGNRSRNQSKGRKTKSDKLIRRDLTEEEKGQLLRAWG
ncbi:MAG: hypothetical protein ACK4VZ_11485 [Paracoccaceae bacterium]